MAILIFIAGMFAGTLMCVLVGALLTINGKDDGE